MSSSFSNSVHFVRIAFHIAPLHEKNRKIVIIRKILHEIFSAEEIYELSHSEDSDEVVFKIHVPLLEVDLHEFFTNLHHILNATSAYTPHFTQATVQETIGGLR